MNTHHYRKANLLLKYYTPNSMELIPEAYVKDGERFRYVALATLQAQCMLE